MKIGKSQFAAMGILALGSIAVVVWFSQSKQAESDRISIQTSAADNADALASNANESPTDPDSEDSRNENSVEASTRNGEVRKLFSTPDYNDAAYRSAEAQAADLLSRLEDWSRNIIVKVDQAALDDLVSQLDSGREVFDTTFQLSPFSDLPCQWSKVESNRDASRPANVAAPRRVGIAMSKCESGPVMRAYIDIKRSGDPSEDFVTITLLAGVWGTFYVKSIGDSGYFLAYRDDYMSRESGLGGAE